MVVAGISGKVMGRDQGVNPKQAAQRVRSFIEARNAHYAGRRKMEMFGASKNPMPELICAEYGALDINDLIAICEAIERR